MIIKGLIDSHSGVPVIRPNTSKGKHFFKLVTFGHRARGFYRALKRDATNPNVIATLQAGLKDAIEIHTDTPSDVKRWLCYGHVSARPATNAANPTRLHPTP